MFYVFCLFTPLYRRFRLSRVSQRIDLDEIYRLVSKILNFMPCGLVFDRFCVLKENTDENLLKIYWRSTKIYEILQNVRKSMKVSWKSMEIYEILQNVRKSMKLYWKSMEINENLTKTKKINENLLKMYGNL